MGPMMRYINLAETAVSRPTLGIIIKKMETLNGRSIITRPIRPTLRITRDTRTGTRTGRIQKEDRFHPKLRPTTRRSLPLWGTRCRAEKEIYKTNDRNVPHPINQPRPVRRSRPFEIKPGQCIQQYYQTQRLGTTSLKRNPNQESTTPSGTIQALS